MKKVLFLMVSMLILGLVFTGCSEIAKISSPATVNTDGELYKSECSSDSATGDGRRILLKGTWFMYNFYDGDGETQYFDIQAGNPKNGHDNIIGFYKIQKNSWNDSYRAYYWIYPVFAVVDEHLAISDNPDFTAKPGKDDNADFEVSFDDPNEDGEFYVFAHFEVECAPIIP